MRILIIKLGAKGDVVRTLPVLIALKKKYPESEIHWITKLECSEILSTSPHINRILTLPSKPDKSFDILYNFDIEEEATSLANSVSAEKKYGFFSEGGYALAFNPSSEYYLNTFFDDELKKSNRKTYQEMMFGAAELLYNKEHHPIYLTDNDKKYAERFLKENSLSGKIIGIHLGASSRWPSKVWHEENLKEFIKLSGEKGYSILLFGGPNESGYHDRIVKELESDGIKIHKNNPSNSDREFCSLVNICDYLVCGDSFALHIALALKKPTVALFFVTSPWEIEGYGILKKIISAKLKDFFPEKSNQYNEELVKTISAQEVLKNIEEFRNKNK